MLCLKLGCFYITSHLMISQIKMYVRIAWFVKYLQQFKIVDHKWVDFPSQRSEGLWRTRLPCLVSTQYKYKLYIKYQNACHCWKKIQTQSALQLISLLLWEESLHAASIAALQKFAGHTLLSWILNRQWCCLHWNRFRYFKWLCFAATKFNVILY